MTTTENAIELEGTPPEKKMPLSGSLRFDWIVTILSAFFIGGGWLDNWAHTHGKVDKTFFTPWHAVLYAAFVVVAAFLVLSLLRNHRKGYPWREALPPGYGLSLLGVMIFAVGGVLDMIWHLLFGIEVSVEALLSPTHLILAFGLVLIVTGPFRAARLHLPAEQTYSWIQLLPALLSLTFVLSSFEGFTQYAHPQVSTWAAANFSQGSANLPFDLYVMNADGSLQTRLISNASNHSVPAWSHNGRQFVFASDTNGGNSQIYVASADGSAETRLTFTRFDEWAPAWSPDDRKIIFTSDRDGKAELYVMNVDGSRQKRLTNTTAWKPAWSPGGQKIAYVSDLSGNAQISVMNADGSGQTRLTHTITDERWPAWSPDGSKIAFSSLRDGNNSEIFIMNADGSGQTRLTTNDAWSENPAWSPDGSKIAFVSYRANHGEVYVMNADGSRQVNLTNNPGTENGNAGIAWSPDGSKMLYTVQAHTSVNINPFLSQDLGLASILLQTVFLMGMVLLLLRCWLPPFGSLTLMFTLSSALISLLNDQYPFVLSALVAGLIADLLIWRLKPVKTRPAALRIFAFVVPIVYCSLYFLVLYFTKGIGWSIHLWMGSIILAGIIGLLLSYLLIPPLAPAIETHTGGTNDG
jgi:hypothetical protein